MLGTQLIDIRVTEKQEGGDICDTLFPESFDSVLIDSATPQIVLETPLHDLASAAGINKTTKIHIHVPTGSQYSVNLFLSC